MSSKGPHASREQVIKCLRDAGWGFKRKGKINELWKRKGSTDRISLPTNKKLPVAMVRTILIQAGLSVGDIEAFLKDADITNL